MIAPLRNPIQDYDWGSTGEIAAIQNRPPSGRPEAELWMGAYPESSSEVFLNDQWTPLVNQIELFVDSSTLKAFGDRLPFLMKFLAIARPLSIQSHPTSNAAEKGFEEGIFKDRYAKPEMVYALSPMEMLCGFRPESEVAAFLTHLGREDLVSELETKSTGELFASTLTDEVLLQQVKAAAHLARELPWLVEILIKHPHDAAAVAPLFLNHVHLEPGQTLFVPAGQVHSYLSGFGVEVMGASDNVVRAGLTTKAVDIPHFVENVDTSSSAPMRITSIDEDGWTTWPVPAQEFRLSRTSTNVHSRGLAIVVCTSGSFTVRDQDQTLTLDKGASAILSSNSAVEINGSGELFRCTLGV